MGSETSGGAFLLLCLTFPLTFCETVPATRRLGHPTATGSLSSSKWSALLLLILTQTGDFALITFLAEDSSIFSYL
jgi:hypothetical protein